MDPLGTKWKNAGEALKFDVIAPFGFTLAGGRLVTASALLPQFGARKGMLLFADDDSRLYDFEAISDEGYGYSCLSSPRSAEPDLAVVIHVLKDWGWSAPTDPPLWLSEGSGLFEDLSEYDNDED